MARCGTTAHIDLAELAKLSAMQCTDEEIAAWFGVSSRTIERRRRVRSFAEIMDRGKAKGRISLRRMQLKLAEEGNPALCIWLGKQLLGQTDQIHHELNGTQINIVCPVQSSAPAASYSGVTIDIGHRELASGK
jgi:hypothetical protein